MSADPGKVCASSARADQQQHRAMATEAKRCLNIEDLNPNIKVMEYAVRGPLVIRAAELEKELEKVLKNNRLIIVFMFTNCSLLGPPILYYRARILLEFNR